MRKLLLIVSGSLLLSLMIMPVSLAEDALVMYEDIDFNTDGWIDRSEALQRLDLIENWDSIDQNSDGVIEINEYLRYEGQDGYGLPYESQDMDPGAGPL